MKPLMSAESWDRTENSRCTGSGRHPRGAVRALREVYKGVDNAGCTNGVAENGGQHLGGVVCRPAAEGGRRAQGRCWARSRGQGGRQATAGRGRAACVWQCGVVLSGGAMADLAPGAAPAELPPDHSALIASKLLQGWALLANSCPVCLTPLVRNRHKQLFCVSCSQWLLTEDQLALKLEAQHVHDSSAPLPSRSQLPPKPALPSSHMRVASLRDDDPSLEERSPKRQASTEFLSGVTFNSPEDTSMPAAPSGPSDQSTANLPKVHANVNPPVVLLNLVSTLYQKLEEIRQAIAACHEIRDLNQLLSALGECMQAIQRTQSLSQSGHPGKL